MRIYSGRTNGPDYTTHPFIKSKKERTGWGRWSTVYTRKCNSTGKEIRIVKNWSGSAPVGGFVCHHCNQVTDI